MKDNLARRVPKNTPHLTLVQPANDIRRGPWCTMIQRPDPSACQSSQYLGTLMPNRWRRW